MIECISVGVRVNLICDTNDEHLNVSFHWIDFEQDNWAIFEHSNGKRRCCRRDEFWSSRRKPMKNRNRNKKKKMMSHEIIIGIRRLTEIATVATSFHRYDSKCVDISCDVIHCSVWWMSAKRRWFACNACTESWMFVHIFFFSDFSYHSPCLHPSYTIQHPKWLQKPVLGMLQIFRKNSIANKKRNLCITIANLIASID